MHRPTCGCIVYLGRRRNADAECLDLAESETLLDAPWAHIAHPALCWTHGWRGGDLVPWYNRATMHPRDPFDVSFRRVLHRTQMKGARVRPARKT